LGYVDSATLVYFIQRIIDTSVGVIMGLIINYRVARPNYYNNTINEFKKIKCLCKESLKNIFPHKVYKITEKRIIFN